MSRDEPSRRKYSPMAYISMGEYSGNGPPDKAGAPTAVDPRVKPGALTRDVNTRLSAPEADPQTKPGAPTAAPAAVEIAVIFFIFRRFRFLDNLFLIV
jgi:hypothetical protein